MAEKTKARARQQRLARALRENLKRRKAQVRSRATGPGREAGGGSDSTAKENNRR